MTFVKYLWPLKLSRLGKTEDDRKEMRLSVFIRCIRGRRKILVSGRQGHGKMRKLYMKNTEEFIIRMILITQFDWLTDRTSQRHRVIIVLHRLRFNRFLGLWISSDCVCHLG